MFIFANYVFVVCSIYDFDGRRQRKRANLNYRMSGRNKNIGIACYSLQALNRYFKLVL